MCILHWIFKLNKLGRHIKYICDIPITILPNTAGNDLEILWKKFHSIHEKLRSFGAQDDLYFAEIKYHFIKFKCSDDFGMLQCQKQILAYDCKIDEDKVVCFLENLKEFKEFLKQKRANMKTCKYPKNMLHELNIKFELIKENFKKMSKADEKKSQEEFSEVLTIYGEMLMEISEQMQKQHKKPYPSTPSTIPTAKGTSHRNGDEGNFCNILFQTNPPLSETEKLHKKYLFENFVDKVMDHSKVSINDPDNIRKLLYSVDCCLNFITMMGLSSKASEEFIARIIIRKLDNEGLIEYENYLNETAQINVFEFLEYKMKKSQKDLKEIRESPNHDEASSLKQNKISIKNKGKKEIQSSLLDEQLIQVEHILNTGKSANKLMNDPQNLVHKNLTSGTGTGNLSNNSPDLVTKPNEKRLLLPPKNPCYANNDQKILEMRSNMSANSSAKLQSNELLENHIEELRKGIILQPFSIKSKLILNLHTPGLSEEQLREYYKTVDPPTSLREFIGPLLKKTRITLSSLLPYMHLPE